VNQLHTTAIVLNRTAYGEADRIVSMLTPDHGKLRLIAKGVRRPKSKLAGGIELFSVSDISYIKGRGEIGTLVSTRLQRHYGMIVTDIDRVQLGYDLIKALNRVTEDQPEAAYFNLLIQTFEALDRPNIDLNLIRSWFQAQILNLSGHMPNLQTDLTGQQLSSKQAYNFDYDNMSFARHETGDFQADHIKSLRLLFNNNVLAVSQVDGLLDLLPDVSPYISNMFQTYLRV
jgi:DNA repair protein RecO